MKLVQRILAVLGILAIAIGILAVSPYSYLIKGIRLTYLIGEKSANYLDWMDFDSRDVHNDTSTIWELAMAENRQTVPLNQRLESMLTETQSGSFLVFRNDTLVCERYLGALAASSETPEYQLSNSFSMAKTITCLLVQKAIQEKIIPSWDEPVRNYLDWVGVLDQSGNPSIQTNPKWESWADSLTLRHLVTMTAGLDWDESYVSPFGITAKIYYGSDAEKTMKTIPVIRKPGTHYQYQSGATQLLGLALSKATGKTISALTEEWLWKPLGMESSAKWQLDRANGKELNYCCFDATARDFGRLGLMVMHHGKSIIDSAFLAQAQQPYKSPNYGHSFWLGEVDGIKFSYYQGLNGQYICLLPQYNMVVVRTGHGVKKGNSFPVFDCVKTYVKEAVALFAK
jgi:CubicO group peptidase (beta-lactamase class C family)